MIAEMSLAKAVHSLVVDLDQLNCLYHQLDLVPEDVQHLFRNLDGLYGRLLDISGSLLLSRVQTPGCYTQDFIKFRGQLVDLELFIDPNQIIPRSCAEQNAHQQIGWPGPDGDAVTLYCARYRDNLDRFDAVCEGLLQTIDPFHKEAKAEAWSDFSGLETPDMASIDYDSLSLPSPFATSPSFMQNVTSLVSPWTSPFDTPQHTPASTPLTIPGLMPAPLYSGPPQPPPLSLGEPLHPAANTNFSRSRRPRARSKTIAERRVQQILEDEFGKTQAAGVKRKRNDTEPQRASFKSLVHAPFPQNGSPQAPGRDSPPPRYPPSSIRLGPREVPYEHPTWSLDDLSVALPTISPAKNTNGKQRALDSSPMREWDSSSSIYTSDSINTHSGHSSLREGSSVSNPMPGHAFTPGSCKLWYSQGSKLNQLTITNIEIRTSQSNNAITLVLKTETGQEILDNLWVPQTNTNAAPFLEHGEILAAMRDQHDNSIHSIVHFAPNPSKHPQYSFTTHGDCQDFMRAVASKLLIASVDIATMKSACTHGNKYEIGCETMQIWQNSDSEPGNRSRIVKLFRNKNPMAASAVVEIPLTCLRAPAKDYKNGKLTFELRDVQDPAVREMKYLKIAFANDLAKDEFLFQAGFIDSDR